MSSLDSILRRANPPVPWEEGDNIPWNDPEFSERMLKEHLTQDHDLASRKLETIAAHAKWISEELLGSQPARVLDLACGPGLYTSALAELGCECVGLDFSPASIRHAEATAAEEKLPCSYRLADLRDGDFGDGFDLVMLIYAQLNVFTPEQARDILRGMSAALNPGGVFLLEPQTHEHVLGSAQPTSSWYTAPSGLFSAEPHLVLQEGYWDADSSTRTERFFVIDAATGRVERHVLPTVAYTKDELDNMITDAGLRDVQWYANLCGDAAEQGAATQVFTASAPE